MPVLDHGLTAELASHRPSAADEATSSTASTALMAGGKPICAAVADQAAEWLTLMMSGEATERELQGLAQWRAAHADHERAWRHIETVTQQFRRLDPRVGYRVLSRPVAPPSSGRRKAFKQLLGWGAAGAAGWALTCTDGWQQGLADHRTGTGEQRSLTLEDGTRLVLNTATAVNVRFDARVRRLQLVAGELWIDTGHAPTAAGAGPDPRPLVVEVAQGRIRALGTRFSVRQWPQHAEVAVFESAVEISPRESSLPGLLHAGERASFTAQAIDAFGLATEPEAPWVRGQLIASHMRLDEFIAELSRYRPGVLHCAPGAAVLRLSGVFPLNDTDRILDTLPNVLPVLVRQRTRLWVVVEPAPTPQSFGF